MRLTLRTLLAWLDDTLSPAEVREIGKQVNESPFAKELVEKIHRVTRQRRLTIPPPKGPEAVDANVISSYLDSELEPEQVAELEKKCLTSDVHLAEVASVHQILSLIGQKAKVPTEARHRMYTLVKGREAVKPKAMRASRQVEPEPVAQPVQPWVTPPAPPRSAYERYGPMAAVVGLIGVLIWSAYMSLSPSDSGRAVATVAEADGPTVEPGVAAEAAPNAVAQPAAPEASAPQPASTPTPDAAPAEPAKEKVEKPEIVTPPGSIGLARKPAGLLLRYNADARTWDRVSADTPLQDQDRLLNLDPFRSTLELGKSEADLVGESEVALRSSLPTEGPRLNLKAGRVVFRAPQGNTTYHVQCGSNTVAIAPPAGAVVGVERVSVRPSGEPAAGEPAIRVYSKEGPVKVTVGTNTETLDSASVVTVSPTGQLTDMAAKATPEWVADKALAQFDQNLGDQFLKSTPAERPIMTCLVEALDEPQPDICRLAISGLRAVGDVSLIVPVLHKKDGPTAAVSRRHAIKVLRAFLAQSPDAAKTLHDQLIDDFGRELAPTAEKLLVGYTPKEALEEATYSNLVRLLAVPGDLELGIRQLALENLKELTGRDDLEYDPENPEGKGLRAWRDLLRDKELHPPDAKKSDK